LEGKGALSVTPGQQIELTGVMKTVRDKEVFVVRSVRANGKTYTMHAESSFCWRCVTPSSLIAFGGWTNLAHAAVMAV
jgi:hypothetical protein